MYITKKRRLPDIVRGFLLLSHPIPVLMHILAVTVFLFLAAWPHFVWNVILLAIAAHAAMQISIAMINDYCDRSADALGKPDKPLSRGLVSPHEALVGGLLMMFVMILLLLPLNFLALLVSLLYLALGQGYNLGLKSTPLSGIVFALAMPLIPLYAFVAVGHILPVLFWLVPIGALLGIALNLANSLPDIEEDTAVGARTLAVVLGVKVSFLLCSLLLATSLIFIGLLTAFSFVPSNFWIVVPLLSVTAIAIAALLLFFGPKKPVRTRKTYFYLVVCTCIMLAGGWLIGVII